MVDRQILDDSKHNTRTKLQGSLNRILPDVVHQKYGFEVSGFRSAFPKRGAPYTELLEFFN